MFGRAKEATPAPEPVSGTDVIRSGARSWNKRTHLGPLASAAEIGLPALQGFIEGRALPVDKLVKLTEVLWAGHRVYDPATNSLKSANTAEARSLGIKPDSPPAPDWQAIMKRADAITGRTR
jgi:hypothetical protein